MGASLLWKNHSDLYHHRIKISQNNFVLIRMPSVYSLCFSTLLLMFFFQCVTRLFDSSAMMIIACWYFLCVCVCDLDPIPDFNVSVNRSSKTINVTVEPGEKVRIRWCYQKTAVDCISRVPSAPITVSITGTFICIYIHTCFYTLQTISKIVFSAICLYVFFRSIHLSLDQLFLTSLTCCPVCACRYFLLIF